MHAVARLKAAMLEASTKPFVARGGHSRRCQACRLPEAYCLCEHRPAMDVRAGFCLLMGDGEAYKPSNTGWLVADMVRDTFAFPWARTTVEPALLALLADPQWMPYVVFPGEFAKGRAVVEAVANECRADASGNTARRPLFILLDGTWTQGRKMFNKSPYLNDFPVLSLEPGDASRYELRRSNRTDHFCTSEVAAMCLALAGEVHAAQVLDAYLDVFSEHYLHAKRNMRMPEGLAAHEHLKTLLALPATP